MAAEDDGCVYYDYMISWDDGWLLWWRLRWRLA